tara:strand:+ start:270 stop:500 length:231 start_codon:yes stop_codon:yes gene_type:complete
MAHEVLQTWEIDGKHHVIPSVGLKKGQSIASFDTANEAVTYAKARSATYKFVPKARTKIARHKKKKAGTLLTKKRN